MTNLLRKAHFPIHSYCIEPFYLTLSFRKMFGRKVTFSVFKTHLVVYKDIFLAITTANVKKKKKTRKLLDINLKYEKGKQL